MLGFFKALGEVFARWGLILFLVGSTFFLFFKFLYNRSVQVREFATSTDPIILAMVGLVVFPVGFALLIGGTLWITKKRN